MSYRAIANKSAVLSKWAAITIGFSVPVSTALDNILLVMVLAFWLVSAGYMQKMMEIRANPVALSALVLFGLLVAGCFYGKATATEALNCLGKYLDLLFIPILISLFREEQSRRHAIAGFMLAMTVTLILSYITRTGLLHQNGLLQGTLDNAYVFKLHITQNIFMAFFAFLLATMARHSNSPRKRLMFSLMAGLAVYNVLYMVQGRTGYLILAILLVYFCFDWLRWKGLLVAVAVGILLSVTAFYGSGAFHQRIALAEAEFSQWQPGVATKSPVGERMEFYRNSLDLIREHPLFGTGTGGFVQAYAENIKGTGMDETRNPHNEYLLMTIQLGIAGLAALFFLFYQQWRWATLLPTLLEQNLARGMLLTIMFGCLINSLLLDHAEGLFFAWMSGVLFAGLNKARQHNEGKN